MNKRYFNYFVLSMLLACQWSFTGAGRAADVVTYHIPLFTQALFFNHAINYWSYWFELRPGMGVVEPLVLTLDYKCSDTLQAQAGRLTVKLNNNPVASRDIPPSPKDTIPWRLNLPTAYLKSGYNEVTLICRQHSYEETCSDAENDANWVRFNVNSSLTLSRRPVRDFPLSVYPFPYLDPLSTDAVQSLWIMPKEANASEIAAMLDVASDWGRRLPNRPINLQVTKTPPVIPTRSQIQFADLQARQNLAPQLLPPQAGWLSGGLWQNGPYAQLYVTGDGLQGLTKATSTLANQATLAQATENEATITEQPLEADTRLAPRMGTTTLQEMGIPQLKIAGAFQQSAALYFNRPVNCDLGKETTLKLHFRHSAALEPSQSVFTLSVWINDKEKNRALATVRLGQDNANDGVMAVRIPVEVLARPVWKFTLDCFNYIGTMDCGKSYQEVAWTEILGDSTLTLMPGRIHGAPYLESFPYFVHADGRIGDLVTCWLPANPSESQLTAAARAAARAGQVNPTPVRWRVLLGGDIPNFSTAVGLLAIGSPTDIGQFRLKEVSLPIMPTLNNGYQVAKQLNVLKNTLPNKVILQAGPLWSKTGGAAYAIVAQDDRQLDVCSRLFASSTLMDTLNGPVCLLNLAGRPNCDLQPIDQALDEQVVAESNRYTLPMYGIVLVITLLLASLIFWFIRLLIGHPSRRPGTPRP